MVEPRAAREIRVFISSTFRDMQRERELLVKSVFPELRRICSERFVTFTEVDLRWGITEEQAAEGRVLPICLEEIRLCRPYFVGLLGERYGWIPESVPPSVLSKEPWLEEHVCRGTSVTELEILHGVLNDPQMAERACFYFRDPRYLDSVPESERAELVERGLMDPHIAPGALEAGRRAAERRAKLAALKDRIRRSGLSLVENYADPETLAALVRERFIALIDSLHPPSAVPDWLDQEALEHECHAERKLLAFVPRPAHAGVLDAFLSDEPGGRGLVVTGESGSGKTTLLADRVRRWRERDPATFLFVHFFGSTPDSASAPRFLARLLGELKRSFRLPYAIPDEPAALRQAVPRWLDEVAGNGRVILVLDALNQIDGNEADRRMAWLPPRLPAHVRVVASTLAGPALEELRKRDWTEHRLEPPDLDERGRMIDEFFRHYRKEPGGRLRDQLATAPGSANPLFLRTVMEELRQFGSFDELPARVAEYLGARTPEDLFLRVIRRWQQDFDGRSDLVRRALSLLWTARRGLSEFEWLQLLGSPGAPLLRQAWSPLFLAMEPHLVLRTGLHGFGHAFLRSAVEARFLSTARERRSSHMHIARHFAAQSGWNARKVAELPWQWQQTQSWPELFGCLRDGDYLDRAWELDQLDVCRFWAALEHGSPHRLESAYDQTIEKPLERFGTAQIVGELLLRCGHPDKSLLIRQKLALTMRLLQHTPDVAVPETIVAGSLHEEAQALRALGRFDDALARLERAEDLFRGKDDADSLLYVLHEKGEVLLETGRRDSALSCIEEGESIARRLGSATLRGFLEQKAHAMRLAGDARGALEALQRAEDQAEQDGDERGKAMLLGRRGQLLRREGRFKEAWECHVKEAQLSREVRNMDGLAAALFGQVNILTGIGEQSRALQTLDEIEELARRSGDRNTLAKCMGTRAGILRRQGRFAEALALHQEEEALFRECHNELGLVIALVNKANCLLDVPGRAAHATPVAYEALTLARRAENAALIERIEAILASIERGNPTEESNNGP